MYFIHIYLFNIIKYRLRTLYYKYTNKAVGILVYIYNFFFMISTIQIVKQYIQEHTLDSNCVFLYFISGTNSFT